MVGLRRVLCLAVLGGACTTMGDVLEQVDGDGGGSGAVVLGDCDPADAASWCPDVGLTWQTQRTGVLDYGVDAEIVDLPLFQLDVASVQSLQGGGRRVVCWFSAGVSFWNDPERGTLMPTFGNQVTPGDSKMWLDIDDPVVREVMLGRIDLAASLGCDAIEPGDLDGYLNDSGHPLTRDGTLAYAQWLADNAHARGLSIALQDANELAGELQPYFDFAIDYGCLAGDSCAQLEGFLAAGKAVLHAELIDPAQVYDVQQLSMEVCSQSEQLSLATIFKKTDLGSWRYPCE